MFWTIEEQAKYIASAVMTAQKENRDIKEAIKRALREITESKNGSGLSGV